jgi:hypothetical protein
MPSSNFQGFTSGNVDGGFPVFAPGIVGGGGWASGLGSMSFDSRAGTAVAAGMMAESNEGYGQTIAHLQIMTPVGPEPLCCIYISSIYISLHQLRSEIISQLPATHLPVSWNFAKLTVNEGAMFVPLQQEHSMSMSFYASPSGAFPPYSTLSSM